MAETLIEFMKQLESTEPPPFTAPEIYYGFKEDALSFYVSNKDSYAERVNALVTLFLSFESKELVGCQVKGVRRKLDEDGNFVVAIKHENGLKKVELGLFFHLLAFEVRDATPRGRLVELAQQAKGIMKELEPVQD